MPPNGYDRSELETEESREVVAQQLLDMQAAVGEADFTWDSEDPADHTLLFVPGRLLVDELDDNDFQTILAERGVDIPGGAPQQVERSGGPQLPGTLTYELTGREDRDPREILGTLSAINETPVPTRRVKRPVATLEHWVHVAPNGDGHGCPATEPEVTLEDEAFPEAVKDDSVGKGVKVVVIDTGYVDEPGVAGDPDRELHEYDGHGEFIEGVIKSRALGATVERLEYPVHLASKRSGGIVSEYVLADLLRQALDMDPDIINISAGCHRIDDLPFAEFRRQWLMRPQAQREKVAVIAAAGNDRSPDPFYPAADRFAFGIGSLDKTGDVSYFSNYEDSGDVYVLGRKHINVFPNGRYTCRWAPHRGEVREFKTGWAEWSGTSFAAPLFAGLVARKMREDGVTARQAAFTLANIPPVNLGAPYGDRHAITLAGPLY
jgi:subtilisin family serine protease